MPDSFRKKSITAIIPAAGLGTRLGRDIEKQFLSISGKPIMALTIENIQNHPSIKEIIVAVPKGRGDFVQEAVIDRYNLKVTHLVNGGENRQESVGNCLKVIGGTDYILVHDGVRPFVSHEIVDKLLQQMETEGAAISAIPVINTTKRINGTHVLETVNREELISVQTPQMFRKDLIVSSFLKAQEDSFIGTDEASIVEHAGHSVSFVSGSPLNIKITTQEDLVFASAIHAHLSKGNA